MSPETLRLIFDVGAAVAARLWQAFQDDDTREIRRLSSVLPEPLRSEVALRYQDELARKQFGDSGN